jgi:hypothetical protein
MPEVSDGWISEFTTSVGMGTHEDDTHDETECYVVDFRHNVSTLLLIRVYIGVYNNELFISPTTHRWPALNPIRYAGQEITSDEISLAAIHALKEFRQPLLGPGVYPSGVPSF